MVLSERSEEPGPPVEERFADGNMTPVVRIGDSVRRSRPAWWESTRALLRHLEVVGFAGAPRVLGVDDDGREMLSYVEGVSGLPSLEGIGDEETLISVAHLLRDYHNAVASFVPAPDLHWPVAAQAPASGPIVCHNDVAPWNTIFRANVPVAFIDWDLAAPAPPGWDIAYALWRYVPFYPGEQYGPPEQRARRAALFCDVYGLSDREGLLEIILQRQRSAYQTVEEWGRAGHSGFAQLYEAGLHTSALDDIAYVERHAPILRRAIERQRGRPSRS